MTRKDVEDMIAAAKAAPVMSVGPFEVREHVNLCMADVSNLDLSGLDLSEANLHGIKAVKTNFGKASLRGANMHGADLDGAILVGANLDNANLCQACACDADFTDASLRSANFSEVCHEDAKGLPLDLETKEIRHGEKMFAGANLTNASPIHED